MSFGRLFLANGNYSPQAVALFARMTNTPSIGRKRLMDTLIKSLIANGIWSTLDGLWVPAAADSQAATLNWVANNALTPTAMTFTADRGFAGNGTSSTISAGISTSLATHNSNAAGVWMNVDVSTIVGCQLAGGVSSIEVFVKRSGPTFQGYSEGNSATVSITNGLGYSALTRTDAATISLQKNASASSGAAASAGFPGGPIYLMAIDGSGSASSTGRMAAAHVGSGLTPTQLSNLYAALLSYLTSIGAN
jgi:hypothetical protein